MISTSLLAIIGTILLGIWFLYKLKTQFSEKLFFKTGMFLFLIQGVANSYGLFSEWSLLPSWAIISKSAGIAFNFLIAYFFYYLMKKTPASMGGEGIVPLTEQELNAFMGEDDTKRGDQKDTPKQQKV